MVWVQRIVGAVFAVGVVALIGAIVTQVGQTQGFPPLPIFLGVLGIVLLILLSSICLALVSLAITVRRGVEAMGRAAVQSGPVPARIFTAQPLREAARQGEGTASPAGHDRPIRPMGKTLVAER
ncbi:hypothetical protein EYF88_02670 [Paracoccus sediminis]|nr:hypothetical protein [Paracoccus sediminis]TBN53119.1 hypothetical protein EYF88_02670 [Paracoccus sediminis]